MKQTLIVFVQDEPGVLNRISSHIRRRNFNIESLVAGRTERKDITRMTLVLNEPNKTKQRIVVESLKQLIDVYDVIDTTEIESHIREYALVKVLLKKEEMDQAYKVIEPVHGKLIDSNTDAMIFELTGYEEEVESVIKSLQEFNILEIVRSGKVAMVAGNNLEHQPELNKSEPNWSTSRILESY
tara:strand:- start:1717 stop:2268 length:552 start_codon:yes stop_codon:yes gene_type:complete